MRAGNAQSRVLRVELISRVRNAEVNGLNASVRGRFYLFHVQRCAETLSQKISAFCVQGRRGFFRQTKIVYIHPLQVHSDQGRFKLNRFSSHERKLNRFSVGSFFPVCVVVSEQRCLTSVKFSQ